MTTTSSSVEAATASLVREYLSRKGLKGTLQKLDEECPRDEFSISNRQALMKHVHLEKLMKKNKEEPEPLKAMLEIMTKHFMERNPRSSSNTHASESGTTLQDSFSSTINFSPQTNQPDDFPVMRTMTRPKTAALTSQRGKSSSDLIIDDDVHGETLMGMGKSGVMAADTTESPLQYAVKAQPVRPVSAKQKSGMVITNDDALARRRRSQLAKSGGLSIPQRDQEKRDTNPRSNFNHTGSDAVNGKSSERGHIAKVSSSPDFVYDSFTSPPKNMTKKQSTAEDPPVSFEALLMKGEERANLLQRIGLENKDPINTKESYKVENSSMMEEKPRVKQKTRPEDFSSNATKMMDLEFGDVDDIEDNLGNLELKSAAPVLQKPAKLTKIHSTPIDLKTAIALKNIVLGLPTQQYNDEWLLQSFSFCDMPDLKYGIVQKKGGPCGVLAAVQAFVIQEMLFGESKLPEPRYKNPTRSERSKLLALALSNILWRAGDFSRAVVTLPFQTTHLVSSSKFKQDGVTERLSIYTFTTFEELSSFLIQSVSQFESDGCPGVIMTMYSAILSRKTHQVRGDFDVPEQSTLIGSHGYCTQELVNLLVTGRAVSNVFNDTVQLDSGGIGDTVTLKGISGRSSVGLLSLFEHYKSCQVGTYYKTPKYPIWVVCSESHFSVLFSTRKDLVNDWKAERRFDLIYYDGLARQQEEIKLTVCTINQSYKPPSSEEDLIPPLEHCIRTKWTDAEIDWNGSEPIL